MVERGSHPGSLVMELYFSALLVGPTSPVMLMKVLDVWAADGNDVGFLFFTSWEKELNIPPKMNEFFCNIRVLET